MHFFYITGQTAADATRALVKAVGKDAFSDGNVRKWYRNFNKGNLDIEEHRGGDLSSGPQTQEQIELVKEKLHQQKTWSIRSLSAATEIPPSTSRDIVVNKLGMKKVNAKWVPHELSPSQMECRLVYSRTNVDSYNQQNSRLTYTFTVDETWISLYRSFETDQMKHCHRRNGKKAKKISGG